MRTQYIDDRSKLVQCWRCGKWFKVGGMGAHDKACLQARIEADKRKRVPTHRFEK